MAVKSNWENGEQFNASDANAVAEAVNAAYVKPTGGVPITDMTASVQVSLGKADTAVQSVTSTSITDSTTTGRAVITAADASAARTTLGVSYGTTAGTVVQGNDSRLTPSSTSITDSTATGRSLITAADAAAARTTLGVAYGSTGGTVAQGNDSRIVGAEQSANKGVANGYASLDGGGKVPVAQLPSSIMEYQGTYNASTNSPSLVDGTGNAGDVYRVSVAGTRNFGAGNIVLRVGDYVIYSGTVWQKSATTDNVASVAGLTGDVTSSSLLGAIATGTPSSSTYLRGDGAWSTVTAGISRSVSTVTSATTLGSTANTDYVVFSNIASNGGADVVALLHGNGSSASTTIVDSSLLASNWTATGDAKLSTATKKFGTASIEFDGTGDYIRSTAALSNFTFGTGNFCIELFAYASALSGSRVPVDFRGTAGIGATAPVIYLEGGILHYYTAGAIRITGPTLSTGTWYHIAVSRSGTSTKLFVDGVQQGSTYTDSNNYTVSNYVSIGNDGTASPTTGWTGFLDEIRIHKGQAIYTANFTAPTAEFGNPAIATLTLPTSISNVNEYRVRNVHGSDSVTIATTSAQTINGSSNLSLAAGQTATLLSNGSNWFAF